jgi:Thermostable hemolysin
MKFIEIPFDHRLRPIASSFIRATYLLNYHARIVNLPKTLLALVDTNDKVHAAAGLRDTSEPFFSEHYLDLPIESLLSEVSRRRVDRSSVVEVSCLASRTPSISAHFMRELVFHGEDLGYDWAFFTATSRLEKLLRHIRLPLLNLGAASLDRVPSPEIWGSYYETDPRVLAFGREHLKPFLSRWLKPVQAYEVHAHV